MKEREREKEEACRSERKVVSRGRKGEGEGAKGGAKKWRDGVYP